jgi:hypothetical protein
MVGDAATLPRKIVWAPSPHSGQTARRAVAAGSSVSGCHWWPWRQVKRMGIGRPREPGVVQTKPIIAPPTRDASYLRGEARLPFSELSA